jgi:hypothetical protein
MRTVALKKIRIDGGTQSRVEIDNALVKQYSECMKEGDEFPALFCVFDGTDYWLVDGFHRYHAYNLLGDSEVDVEYKPGTQAEAQILSFGMNGRHGKNRTVADKRKAVIDALEHHDLQGKSNYEIAKICDVSQSFVASIRSVESKEKQQESKEKHVKAKAEKLNETDGNTSQTSSFKTTDAESPAKDEDFGPSDDEIAASELARDADIKMLHAMTESDDALKVAVDDATQWHLKYSQLLTRFNGLMHERNECVKMIKELQAALDKRNNKK